MLFLMMYGQLLLTSSLMLGNGLMGLPPGELDPALARCAPRDTLFYSEWATRTGGTPGAKGIEGLAADPEVRDFLKESERFLRVYFKKRAAKGSGYRQTLAQHLPDLAKIVLNRSGCIYAGHDGPFVKPKEDTLKGWLRATKTAKATIVINGGKQADRIEAHIRSLLAVVPKKQRKKRLDHQPVPLPDGLGEVILHRHKHYFIVGYGRKSIDSAIAGLSGKSKGLLADPGFVAAMKRVRYKRTASLMWIDLPRILKKANGLWGREAAQILDALKIGESGPIALSTGVVRGAIHHRVSINTKGKADGMLALVSGRPLKAADFKHVPADADLVMAFSVSAPKLLSVIRKAVAAGNGKEKGAFEKAVRNLEKELGVRLEKDLFAAFGDTWVIHNSKSAGGLFVSNLVIGLQIRDADRADDVYIKLMDSLEESFAGKKASIDIKKFMGHTIYAIRARGSEVPLGFQVFQSVSLCKTKTHLLISVNPQALKAHLRFLKSKSPSWTTRIGKDIHLFHKDARAFSFLETKPVVRFIYGYASLLWQALASSAQDEKFSFDIFALPSARGILPYVGNSVSSIRKTQNHIVIESRSSLPIPYNALAFLLFTD